MKISVITVAYQSAKTLEETMQSVLGQTYADVEYLVVDGGSTDGTVALLRQYEKAFGGRMRWVSEPDQGIYDAMNKGIRRSTGEIIGMINADDWYEPTAVATVNQTMSRTKFDLFYADLRMWMDETHSFIKHARNRRYATSRDWNHPTTFITKEMYQTYHYRNETIHDDYDLILRMKKDGVRIVVVNEVLANFRMNGVSHERRIGAALSRAKIKYQIYRRNGYSPFYLIECYGVELAKLIIG